MRLFDLYNDAEIKLFENCSLCPRECKVNRLKGNTGYCGMDAGLNIASICIHKGEEPPVSGPDGICNIFFAGCNLRCIYCQNYEISRPGKNWKEGEQNLGKIIDNIERILQQGIRAVGFVSPSHLVPQMNVILRGIKDRGLKPVTVYNTNSYDKAETIDKLNGIIDVYLPDYKYVSPDVAGKFSDAQDYPDVALSAVKRMYFQKGSVLHLDDEGRAESGMLIRHLVLPDQTGESKAVLESIASELSPGVHVSLMSQYHPTPYVRDNINLSRPIYETEYGEVVLTMENLGFRNGWIQNPESHKTYRPDFRREHPFE